MMARLCLFVFTALFAVTPAYADQFYVKSHAEYFSAAKQVKAGDVIILANGNWKDFEIVLTGRGTKDQPISLISEDPGKVVITGNSNLRIGGEYILVSGLVFRDGSSPTGEVISFRRSKDDQARNSRITEVVIDGFSKVGRFDDDYWVGMYGNNNRFDHNYLVGKTNKGVTMAVRLDTAESRDNGHRIDHNYFGARPNLGSNGGETLRIGTSTYSMHNSGTIVEDNYFENCDGEIEIISIKSGGNIVRRNVFDASRGALTLRHGNDNVIERNIFLGRGEDHTGGIRVINQNQTVRGNYMEGLRGTGFASALTVMNGVPNSPVNRYVQVSNARIERNSILDSARITFGAGSDDERSAAPVDSSFTGNLMSASGTGSFLEADADTSGITFANNLVINGRVHSQLSAINTGEMELMRAQNGLLYPVGEAYANLGAPRDLVVLPRDQAGPAWYPKPTPELKFDSGNVISVSSGEDTLSNALEGAKSGDRLQLAAGNYTVNKTLLIDRTITVSGPVDAGGEKAAAGVTISFARPSLFEIAEGGNLKLVAVAISGADAPDNVGNNVIRTSAVPIKRNFVIELDQVSVSDLTVNKFFDVIVIGKSAMADRISIRNSRFSNIAGMVLNAAAETDDYGQYNAEYILVENSTFANVENGIASVYRGGKDESTFGPHFKLSGSVATQVGKGSNNASGAALLLHGVQDIDIIENSFDRSAPVKIVQTVGTPSTVISNNTFDAGAQPVIEELFYDGPSRVEVSGSKFTVAISK